MRVFSVILLAGIAALSGCDIVENPVPSGQQNGGSGGTVKRRALLEEFTGHHCNNCPAAHAAAAQLHDFYGDDLILVNLHAAANFNSSFIAPQSNPDGSYATDFRTSEGQAYATNYAVTFLPSGMVNRTPYDNVTVLSSANWGSAVDAIVNEDALVNVWIDDLAHDAGTNTVSATVKVALLADISSEHKLTVYLTEDHVIDWQYNSLVAPPDVEFYDHRHVFRKTLDGAWGRVAVASSASVGDTLTFSYVDVPMDPAWDPANCALVAYVYEASSNEVLQAAEREFVP
jgi:hypothetical protein